MADRGDQQHGGGSDARERALVARIASHNRDAFRALYSNYQPRLFRFIFRFVRAYDVADEVTNDVLLSVWRGAANYRGEARVSTWIFGIAYRQAMRRLSKKSVATDDACDPDDLPSAVGPDIEQEDWVRAAIEELPDAQRAAVILVFYAGLTYEEAAAVADCPTNTIKTRMFHARRKLRESLGPDGLRAPETADNEKQHA